MPTKEINVVYEAANHKFPVKIHPQKWTGIERYDIEINGVRELDIIRRNGELEYHKIMPGGSFFYSDDILIIYDMINEQLANGEVWDHLAF